MIAVLIFKELQSKTLFLLKSMGSCYIYGRRKMHKTNVIKLFMGKQTLGFSA
jgi:hypothetical protein